MARFHQTDHGRAVAKFIHDCRLEGKSFDAIAKGLALMVVVNSKGRVSWSVGTVYWLYRLCYGERAILLTKIKQVRNALRVTNLPPQKRRLRQLSQHIRYAARYQPAPVTLKNAVSNCELVIESARPVEKAVPA